MHLNEDQLEQVKNKTFAVAEMIVLKVVPI